MCQAYDLDPGAVMGDDVWANDLRTAFLISRPEPQDDAAHDDRAGVVTDLEDEMRRIAARAGIE